MSRNDLLPHRSKLLLWLGDKAAGRLFSEWLHSQLVTEQKKLQTLTDPHDIYRAQGAVSALRDIIGLENFLRQYEKDVLAGKVKEPTTNVHAANTGAGTSAGRVT